MPEPTTHEVYVRAAKLFSEAQQWYASGGGIAKCGPFPTQRKAWEAMKLTTDARKKSKTESPYPPDCKVWPEWKGTS